MSPGIQRLFWEPHDFKRVLSVVILGFFFQGVHLTLDYDNMYSETDFTPEIQYMYNRLTR